MPGCTGSGVSGLGQCRVAAFQVFARLVLADFFITISHCAWRRVISLSKATKKRSKESAFNSSTLSVHSVQFSFIGAPKARCSPEPRMCEPLFLRTRIPHASPPVTEPAQGAPRAIRGEPSTKFVRMPNHCRQPVQETRAIQKRVRPCGFRGKGACPRAYGAKRFTVRIREKEGFTHP